MKLVHVSDLHLGVTTHSGGRLDAELGINARVADFARRWADCCAFAVAKRADALLFSGDAFNQRNPDAVALRVFAQGIVPVAKAGIPVVLLVGNHDAAAVAGRAHALSVFQAMGLPKIYIVERPQVLDLATPTGQRLLVAGLPWPAKSWVASYAPDTTLAERDALLGAFLEMQVQKLAAEVVTLRGTNATPAVLLAHIGVTEAQASGAAGMMMGREVQLPLRVFREQFAAFDYVGLGHYHRMQVWTAAEGGNALEGEPFIAYAGSVEGVDFGEEDEPKGWLTVDIGTAWPTLVQHHAGYRTAPRRFRTIKVDCREVAEPTPAILAAIAQAGDLQGAIVRLEMKLLPHQGVAVDEAALMRALAAAWSVAPFVKLVERPSHVRLALAGHAEELTPEAALDAYLELQTHLSSERRAQLRAVGLQIIANMLPLDFGWQEIGKDQ